jgi:predicted ATP-grasp superfamily ATP-dependent carboligase
MYKDMTCTVSHSFLADYNRPLIQEYIPGKIHDVATMSQNGVVKGALTQIREITYPIYGGTGSVNVTTDESDLKDSAVRLLEAANWHGPAQAEFKLDLRDSTYKLMEVNPKFWGTLDLSLKAGINFLDMACQIAIGNTVIPKFDYKQNYTYRWITNGELRSVAQDPHKGRAISGFLRRFFNKNTTTEVDFSDIIPDLVRTFKTILAIVLFRIDPAGTDYDNLYQSNNK